MSRVLDCLLAKAFVCVTKFQLWLVCLSTKLENSKRNVLYASSQNVGSVLEISGRSMMDVT